MIEPAVESESSIIRNSELESLFPLICNLALGEVSPIPTSPAKVAELPFINNS